jgi:hypothetical protein
MRKIYLLFFVILIPGFAISQGEANFWYFGVNAGLNFNYNPPIAVTDGAIVTPEGSAVACDASGQLLFYTDGVTVWNKQHQILCNGNNLLGGESTTQSSLIVQKPGSNSIYYLFTIEQAENITWRLSYSEVDMALDGGLGGITTNKNVVIFSPVGEKITAVKHANNQDLWIISHDKFSNRYLTFNVKSSGVNPNPTILNAGSIDNYSSGGIASPNTGYLKASPLGDKIACAFTNVNKVDILNFNNATGSLSYDFTINNVALPYGVEFSPNGELLYISGIIPPSIKQYNLSLTNASQIINTSISLPIELNPYTYSLQLGIDGKIYCDRNIHEYLDCIQNPNSIGTACNYLANAVYLEGKKTQLGLPNFAPFLLVPPTINALGHCSGDSVYFSSTIGAAVDSLHWNFGDPGSGAANYSNQTDPIHVYNHGGAYQVSLIAFQGNQTDTTYTTVNLIQTPSVSFPADTFFCIGSLLELDAGAGSSYIWNDGSNNQYNAVFNPGIYYVTASNICGSSSDTIEASMIFPPSGFDLGNDLNFCEGSSVFLDVTQNNASYLWQNGSTGSQFTVTESGEFFVTVFNECGAISDTLFSTVNPLPTVFLGEDIFLCNQSSITLIPNGVASDYVWSDGSTNPTITVDSSGIFAVFASNSCGTVSDTILVRLGNNSEHTIEFNVCEPIVVNGIAYNESGSYTQSLVNSSGCDSILTIEAEIQNFNAQIFQTDTTLYFNGNPTSIQWFNCATGQAIPGATQTSFVPQTTGNYGAVITIGECVDTSNCRLIPVPPVPQTPPDLCENIRVSPNPVSDVMSFTLDKDNYAIRLFAPTGALLWQKAGTPEKQEIDFRNYAPAMYVLEVDQCRFKIVKQ